MKQLERQLYRWQRRERLYRFSWGFARFLALVSGGLFVCCLTDWWVDQFVDTPYSLRVGMTAVQLVIALIAAWFWLLRLNVPHIDVLAGLAEEKIPKFGHRLVTALQLNRPNAKTAGMSQQLIRAVTHEAEEMSVDHDLARLADHTRRNRALYLALPLILIIALLASLRPQLLEVLLARQALLDIDIPRSVSLKNVTTELWPSGDEVTLRFEVKGAFRDDSIGSVTIFPEGQPSEKYILTYATRVDDETAIFISKLPPISIPLTFRARLRDGRTRTDGQIRFEPRPVVKEIATWLRMPSYVDPEGKRRYERFQPQGEVTSLPNCGLRIETEATKPLTAATVLLMTRDERGIEVLAKRLPMVLGEDKTKASLVFDIPPRTYAYRIEVVDEFGFQNINPPRRGITHSADDPPQVNLLTEVLKDPTEPGPLEDYEVTGMPLVLGGQVQVAYHARSPLGLSKAFIMYRVNDGDWTPLPLSLTVADPKKLGKFVPELGVFENSGPFGQVEFYPFPSPNIEEEPPGLEAGGRYSFQTAALKKKLAGGSESRLELGDRVEFYVAVNDRNPDPNRPPGKSESRIKAVVSQAMLEDWTRQRDQSRERLKQLEERQRGVFKPISQ